MKTVILIISFLSLTVSLIQAQKLNTESITYHNSEEYSVSESDIIEIFTILKNYLSSNSLDTDLDIDYLIDFFLFTETDEMIYRSYRTKKHVVKFYLTNNTVSLRFYKS
jgi:uncharacterized membrane protein